MNIFSLDIETRSTNPDMVNFAVLEPFRVRQGNAEISSIAVIYPDKTTKQIINKGNSTWSNEVRALLASLKNERVFAQYTVFDVAWLIATLEPNKFKPIPKEIANIHWADTKLLAKWLINGQLADETKFSYSLKNLAATFLPDHPRTTEFVEIKSQDVVAGEDEDYWLSRGLLDVIMTQELALKFMDLVPESMRFGLLTEWSCIVPVANSYINGLKIDVNKIEQVEADLVKKMTAALKLLQVEGTVISSTQQLGRLLFDDWGLRPWSKTPKGQNSTSGGDIMHIQYELKGSNPKMAEKLQAVIDYKLNKTLKSKYIDTLKEALGNTHDGYIYGSPKLFGTYTGRMTYSNNTLKKWKTSIALHQIPRKAKEVRSLLIAPEGYGIIEADAAGQESRLMAIRSGDPVMIDIFKRGLNFHSMTGASIIGMDYDEFMKRYKAGDLYIIEQRQLGKLDNLSCNYRIGGKALAEKAFTEYDTYMTEETGRFLVNTFARSYAGVPQYWSSVIKLSKDQGYTETFGGRRYKLHKWSTHQWMTESSAINTPIQGSGADMKEIGISVLAKSVPEAIFCLDLHDGIFFYSKLDKLKETAKKLGKCLNDIDYSAYWGFELPIDLPYDTVTGHNLGEVK